MTDPKPPTMRYIPGDADSTFHRVQVKYPDSALTVNVGSGWVEWGTDDLGMNGADIELQADGGFLCRFQESTRIIVLDSVGCRVYNSDDQDEDALILRLDHADHHAGLPPVLGPAARPEPA